MTFPTLLAWNECIRWGWVTRHWFSQNEDSNCSLLREEQSVTTGHKLGFPPVTFTFWKLRADMLWHCSVFNYYASHTGDTGETGDTINFISLEHCLAECSRIILHLWFPPIPCPSCYKITSFYNLCSFTRPAAATPSKPWIVDRVDTLSLRYDDSHCSHCSHHQETCYTFQTRHKDSARIW